MNIMSPKDGMLTEIGCYKKCIAGKMVIYSLFKKETEDGIRYGVCIAHQEERESCYLNSDLFSSVSFFEKLVKGKVFPYSLCELVEDFWKEQKICF